MGKNATKAAAAPSSGGPLRVRNHSARVFNLPFGRLAPNAEIDVPAGHVAMIRKSPSFGRELLDAAKNQPMPAPDGGPGKAFDELSFDEVMAMIEKETDPNKLERLQARAEELSKG